MRGTYGPWEVEATLGVGGMGVVHRVRHAHTHALAALKVAERESARGRRALRREAAALKQLDHPSIVSLVDDGTDEAEPWYAMALLSGQSLGAHIGADGSRQPTSASPTWTEPTQTHWVGAWGLPPQHAQPPRALGYDDRTRGRLRWVAELCHALCHLHAHGFVHCDLKPSNVLIVDDHAVLVDFGLVTTRGARIDRDSILSDARVAGTAAYMSPERAAGREFDARADLYALGCILYAVITGSPPFVHPSSPEVMLAQMHTPPVPLADRAPETPRALADLVDALLQKDPAARPGHAQRVLRVLEGIGVEVPEWPVPDSAPLYLPALRGRSEALQALCDAADGLRDRGRALWIVGESGVGKSRLVRALAARLSGREGPLWWIGGCTALQAPGGVPVPSQIPLELFADPIRQITDRAISAPHVASAIAATVGPLAPWLPFVAAVCPEVDTTPPGSAAAARHRVCRAVVDTLAAASDGMPAVIVLDDLQWADDLSMSALSFLLRSLDRHPWLVIGLSRSEAAGEPLRAVAAAGEALPLDPLDDDDIRAIARDILGQPLAPDALLDWVAQHAGGNPLFVSECLRAAASDGSIALDGEGGWSIASDRADGLAQQPLPQTLDALMAARLRPLSASALAMVRAAAVIGRSAPLALAARVARMDLNEAERAVDELRRRAIAAPEVDDAAEAVAFVHDRLVERVYTSIPEDERAALHGRAADALAGAEAGRGQIGWHLERGGRPVEAIDAYAAAAEAAVDQLTLPEAELHYRDAIRLAADRAPDRAPTLRLQLARAVLMVQGRARETARELDGVLEALPQAAVADRIRGELCLGRAISRLGREPEALDRFEAARQLAEAAGLPELAAQALSAASAVFVRTGRPDEAARLGVAAIARLGEGGPEAARATFEQQLATVYNLLSRNDEALSLLDRALAVHVAAEDLTAEAAARSKRANVLSFLGRNGEAADEYRRALAIQRRLGNRQSQGALLGNWASLMLREGRTDEAAAQFREALAIHRETGDVRFQGVVLRSLAAYEIVCGALEAALELLSEAERCLAEVGDPLWIAHCDILRTRLMRYTADASAADASLRAALDTYRRMGATTELGDGLVQAIYNAIAFGGEVAPAQAELQQISADADPKSLLGQAREAGELAVARRDAGEALLAGQDPDALPQPLRARVIAAYAKRPRGCDAPVVVTPPDPE